jgi:lipid-A-disaccharide synthase
MIVTGESSGELYGSLLAKVIKQRYPDIHIVGMGGEKMRSAGVDLISGISSAFGISEVFSALRDLNSALKKLKKAIIELIPDVIVLIDFPDFNLKIADFAKTNRIKILYYVSPQVWAWRKNRVKKIARLVDRMAVILPFEEEIYRMAGIRCEFVGHPIAEEIEKVLNLKGLFSIQHSALNEKKISTNNSIMQIGDISKLRTSFKASLGFDPDRPLLSLLPGSRPNELNRHFPLIIEVVKNIKNDPEINSGRGYQFCVPLALNLNEVKYKEYLEKLIQEGAVIKKGETIQALTASDMAVIASGTATLQAAFLEVPMIVIYKLSPLSYLIGKMLVDLKYISLVNILSKEKTVPELLQKKANAGNIIKEIKRIMFDAVYREKMINQFKKVKGPFIGLNASKRVSEIIAEIAGWEQ